jgi:hypothetical protein
VADLTCEQLLLREHLETVVSRLGVSRTARALGCSPSCISVAVHEKRPVSILVRRLLLAAFPMPERLKLSPCSTFEPACSPSLESEK